MKYTLTEEDRVFIVENLSLDNRALANRIGRSKKLSPKDYPTMQDIRRVRQKWKTHLTQDGH